MIAPALLPDRPQPETHADAALLWRREYAPGVLRSTFAPAPQLTLSQWAGLHRILSREASAEHGQWRNDRAPYLCDIMDTLTDPVIEEVVWVAASQLGKTEVGLNLAGYHVHQDPSPLLVVQPSLAMAEAWSKDRLAPMVRDCAALRDRIADPRSRDSGNRILHKTFTGGHLTIVGANSAAGLASRPIRVLILDEIDRYPASAGSEGDPVALAEARTATFWNRKKFKVSSPGREGESRIWPEYEASDQRRFYLPCPHCDHMQVLQWEPHIPSGRRGLVWDVEVVDGKKVHHTDSAAYECESCHALIEEHQKQGMLAKGEWRATNPDGRFPGFHLSALYSPWARWKDLASGWLRAMGDPDQEQAFVNTKLALLYREENRDFSASTLDNRREKWGADIPNGVGILTAGVDVQGDRLEVAVWGWGAGEECWLILHERISGDPEAAEVWSRLEAVRTRAWKCESGREVRIWTMAVDAGYLDTTVYKYVRPRESAGVLAVFGAEHVKNGLLRPVRPNKHGTKPVTIDVTKQKDVLFKRLPLMAAGPGYIHLCEPTSTGADSEFIAQFGGEVLEWKLEHGRRLRRYKAIRKRVEAIDLYVYGRAALHMLGPTILQTIPARARELAEPLPKADANAPKPPTNGPGKRRGWLNNY